MIEGLTWELCDRADQSVIATLDDREEGARVIAARNTSRVAEVMLALEDPAVDDVVVGDTLLRCSVSGWSVPLFLGRVVQAETGIDEDGSAIRISAADPMSQLEASRVFVTGIGFTPTSAEGYKAFTAADPSQMMMDLIDLTSGTGIVEGTLDTGAVNRDLTFPAGSSIADGIRGIAALLDAPEFELSPVFDGTGTICEFNTYHPTQGADLTGSVILRLGVPGQDDTLDGFSYVPSVSGMVNRYVAIGDALGTTTLGGNEYPLHPSWRASHAASIAAYGVWESSEAVSGVTDTSILQDLAEGVVAANATPIETFSVSLDPETAPDAGPGQDFWIGDVIAIEVQTDDRSYALEGRVASVSYVELENGIMAVDLTCEPSAASGVSGGGLYVVIDAGDGTPIPPPPEPEPADDDCPKPIKPGPDPCAKKKKKKKKKKGR